MSEKEYLEKDVFAEHSRFMERFLAKMDEDRREAREERRLAEIRLKEERKEAEARLERADERLIAERRTLITMYITLILSVGIGFLAIFLAILTR